MKTIDKKEEILLSVRDVRVKIMKAQNLIREGKLIDAERYLTFALNGCEGIKNDIDKPVPIRYDSSRSS